MKAGHGGERQVARAASSRKARAGRAVSRARGGTWGAGCEAGGTRAGCAEAGVRAGQEMGRKGGGTVEGARREERGTLSCTKQVWY